MIKDFIKKNKEIILYVIFGVLTTIVNFTVYFLCKAFGIQYKVSNVIAWFCSVLFAFVTNKLFVFDSKSSKKVLKEIIMFFAGRVFSLLLEMVILIIAMDWIHAGNLTVFAFERELPVGEFITKVVAGIVVLVTNYIISKFIVFRNKRGGKTDENTCD